MTVDTFKFDQLDVVKRKLANNVTTKT